MSKLILFFALCSLALTGCTATNSLAKGVSEKSISGSGTIMISRAGLDKTSQTPELFNLLVVGDYNSIANGDELIRLEFTQDASIFNSNAVSKRYKLIFSSSDKTRIDQVLADSKSILENAVKK